MKETYTIFSQKIIGVPMEIEPLCSPDTQDNIYYLFFLCMKELKVLNFKSSNEFFCKYLTSHLQKRINYG